MTPADLELERTRRRLAKLGVEVDRPQAPDPLRMCVGSEPSHALAADGAQYRRWARRMRRWMSAMNAMCSLEWTARSIERLPLAREPLPRDAALSIIRGLGEGPQNECLITSLVQAAFLARNAIPFHITIGVWVPMAAMHAWVTVPASHASGGRDMLVTEKLDHIAHYQPAVQFSYA